MLTKAEDDLIDRMSFDEYMKFAEYIISNSTCRSNLDEATVGYRCKYGGADPPSFVEDKN